MDKIIICQVPISEQNPSGTAIVLPAPGFAPEDVLHTIPANTISHRIATKDKLPADREFRNAWTDENPTDTVDIHMDRAREIQANKLRQLRKPLMEALDVEFMRAVEQSDTNKQNEIALKKQQLRDVTQHPSLLNATTPEELSATKNLISG